MFKKQLRHTAFKRQVALEYIRAFYLISSKNIHSFSSFLTANSGLEKANDLNIRVAYA
jgi:hypothetical protein